MDLRIARVTTVVTRNIEIHTSAETMAKIAGVSTSRFRYIFQRHVGHSPSRWLKRVRLERAKELLIYDEYSSVKEIMASVGINDPSHFVRDFERAFGLSPARYRERYGKSLGDSVWCAPQWSDIKPN